MEIVLGDDGSYLRSERDGARFLPLGLAPRRRFTRADVAFIQRRSKSRGNNIWATLGPWDDRELPFTGRLLCSTQGSQRSVPEYAGQATMDEIANVREAREAFLNRDPETAVIERYISFEDIQLNRPLSTFTLDALPQARLTVFVGSDEGALVFLQRMPRGSGRGKRKLADADDTDVEYLLPEATDDDHDCSSRDRLNYRIPLYPEAEFELAGDGSTLQAVAAPDCKVVLKVLVFKRRNSSSYDVIQRAATRLGLSRHNLLRYRPEASRFEDVEGDRIEPGARTLLLLHGTFSSTEGTFGDLYNKPDPFLAKLIAGGHFEQILALDHDTLFVPPAENVSRFDEIMAGYELHKPVRAIGFSRGALLLKQMAISSQTVEIEHGVTVAGANHVGYFSALRGLNWLLTALRYMTPPGAGLRMLSVIAQHSDKALDRLEGLRAMDRTSEINRSILTHPTLSTTLIPIRGAFHPDLVEGRWKRITRRTLNAAISVLLTTRSHDWVVATAEQARIEPLTGVGQMPEIRSRHTRMIGQKLPDADLKSALLWGR
jgi:hypothetical protein